MKTCTKCNTEKELTEFYGQLTRGTLRASCKSCEKQRRKTYYQQHRSEEQEKSRNYNRKNRKYHRNKSLQYKYGIDDIKYTTMWNHQKGKCLVCNEPEQDKALAVDHCHTTGNVRGLLCSNCNTGLGQFQDNPELLYKAAEYLKSASA